MNRDTSKLPMWAQKHISELKEKVQNAEATIPWTKPGMEWFTLFSPSTRDSGKAGPRKLFTCSEDGTLCVCTLGPNDFVFVGRARQ